MLFIKRLVTSIALFIVLVIVLFLGVGMLGAGLAGALAERPSAASAQNPAQRAGYQFGERYGKSLFLGAVVVSAVASVTVSFSGALPWCRRKLRPPPIP
jgi:hypothetical protein